MPPIAHPPAFYAKIAGICFVVRMLSGRLKEFEKRKERRALGGNAFWFSIEENIGDLDLDDNVEKKNISQPCVPDISLTPSIPGRRAHGALYDQDGIL